MRRNLAEMAGRDHDLVIVGGGIYGACMALETAAAGYRVGLVERDDFGSGTSFNSLRIIHGGLRYLQHLDLGRMRESIRARREWLRFAPDLVRPTDFVLPTVGRGARGWLALGFALRITDLVGWDRNAGCRPDATLARSRLYGRAKSSELLGALRHEGFTGAAVWQDAVCLSTERLLIRVLRTAVAFGAHVANYASARRLLLEGDRAVAVEVEDTETGNSHVLRAGHVINCAGPWTADVLEAEDVPTSRRPTVFSQALNLVLRTDRIAAAIGIPVPRSGNDPDAVLGSGTNTYFMVPWNGLTLVGTKHLARFSERPGAGISPGDVDEFLGEINDHLSGPPLRRENLVAVLSGWLPEAHSSEAGPEPVLEKRTRIWRHGRRAGPRGVTSVLGVKWTTAWEVARRVTNELRATGSIPPEAPNDPPLDVHSFSASAPSDMDEIVSEIPGANRFVVEDSLETGATVIRATRQEMARTLEDVVFRRSHLWLSGRLSRESLDRCAQWMARERGWTEAQRRDQVLSALVALEAIRGGRSDPTEAE